VKRALCRIYDPIREEMYRDLGLESISPTVAGASMLKDLLDKPPAAPQPAAEPAGSDA
jgi:trk system potassium uptake protein TrkA